MNDINSPIAVVAILGIAMGGVAALVREISFGISKMMGKSALDNNHAVMKELVSELKTHGQMMTKILDEQKETKQMVHDIVYEKKV